jgi:hypothetical protein
VAQGAERAGNQGAEAVYTDNAGERAEVRELLYLTAVVQDAALPDASIEKQSCRRLCGHHHEPLTDEGYIPCVSLLDFQKTGGKLDMTAYCRALDFGCKAYVNLVMLHLIQKEIAEKTGIPCGKLILIVKSARFYLRDREKVLAIIDKVH